MTRLFFVTVAAALVVFASSAISAVAQRSPNIIFILVDDLRWDELGSAGHPVVKAPNIDRLAHEGALFANAFVTTPQCSPSRANFLTGQYARTNGIIDNTDRSEQTHRLRTWPLLLNQHGYRTAFLGKWHMGNDPTRRPGWDYWVCLPGQGRSFDPQLNINDTMTEVPGYVTDILTDHAVDFIERERNNPFVIYLAHKALHPESIQLADGRRADPAGSWNFVPPERHKDLYKDDHIPRRPNSGRPPYGKPALMRKIGDLPPLGHDTSTTDEMIRNRWRILASVDESLGRIMDALEQQGILDNTLIVLAGDQGLFYGEHGLRTERRLAYEESIRIPLLMRWPQVIRPGVRPAQAVLSIDVAPTALEVAGAPIPADIQGFSLLPALKGEGSAVRDAVVVEYYSDIAYPRIYKMGYEAIRMGDWKYIRYLELDGMDELYDLRNDPYEMKNLIGDPGVAGHLGRLRNELERRFAAIGERPPPRQF